MFDSRLKEFFLQVLPDLFDQSEADISSMFAVFLGFIPRVFQVAGDFPWSLAPSVPGDMAEEEFRGVCREAGRGNRVVPGVDIAA